MHMQRADLVVATDGDGLDEAAAIASNEAFKLRPETCAAAVRNLRPPMKKRPLTGECADYDFKHLLSRPISQFVRSLLTIEPFSPTQKHPLFVQSRHVVCCKKTFQIARTIALY